MAELNQANADAVVNLLNAHFEQLPKSGKPGADEWTVASAIIEVFDDSFKIVSFGTGSKCLARNRLNGEGDVVHDGHAEVVARRGFLLYLIDELRKGRVVKEGVKFWMVSSLMPCGDASIMPMGEDETFFW